MRGLCQKMNGKSVLERTITDNSDEQPVVGIATEMAFPRTISNKSQSVVASNKVRDDFVGELVRSVHLDECRTELIELGGKTQQYLSHVSVWIRREEKSINPSSVCAK